MPTKAQIARQEKEAKFADLAFTLLGLREFYPEGNAIRAMLEELIADLTQGAPRHETLADAKALLAKLDPNSTAYRLIGHVAAALSP